MISQSRIEEAIAGMFSGIEFQEKPQGLYDPLRYMIALGGKRIRPRLCLTTYGIFKDSFPEEILSPAAAIEVFHTFTLIHDDIMDRSALRRGSDTVWKKWDEDTAILSGDVMSIDSYKRIAKAPAAILPQVLELFSKTASQVCDGQQLDMDFEKRDSVSMDEYMEMIGLKTAVLIACSAKMGALIGGAPLQVQDALYDYGYSLGLAFQVADDYLDAYGDEAVFGKPIGGDILNCKKSWLTVKAQEKGASCIAQALSQSNIPGAEKIARVKELYDSVSVAREALKEIKRLNDEAVAHLSRAGLDREAWTALVSFAHNLVGRTR